MITSVSIPYYYLKLNKLLIRTKAFSMIKQSRQWISSLFFMEVSISFQVGYWTSVWILCFSYPFFPISYFSVSWFSFLADFSISSFKYSTNFFLLWFTICTFLCSEWLHFSFPESLLFNFCPKISFHGLFCFLHFLLSNFFSLYFFNFLLFALYFLCMFILTSASFF